jgi:hypothetical protein
MSASSTPATLREAFVHQVEAFCAAKQISEDKFGRLACRDHHAIPFLRRGRATLKRLEQINALLRAGVIPKKAERS